MAAGRIVVSQYSPARDRNDKLVAGAKLYVYANRTTTPVSIYADSALTTPLANPVVANSSGAFASIWASDAALYTVEVTGASGESIGNPSSFDDYSVTVDWFAATAAATSATAAAASATSATSSATSATASATSATASATSATASATSATASQTAAAASATSASASATTATAAANVATALGNMYATTAAGLAATASGGYFSVEPDSSGIIYCYRDDAGVATKIGQDYVLATDHKSRKIVPPRLLDQRSQGLKLRKALSDIRAGTRKSLRIMAIGDSLVGVTWQTVHVQLMKELEGWMQTTPVYAHSISVLDYGTYSSAAASSTSPLNYTGTLRAKLDYDAAWDGTLMWLDAAQASNFSIGGLAVQGDKIHIPIIREPGAGTVKIEIANATTPPALGGAWVNPTVGQITSGHALTGAELLVNANGTFGVEMVTLSVALGSWTVKVTQTAGSRVRVRFPMHEVTTAAAFNVWRVGYASNDFTSSLAAAETIEAAQIASYNPDIIVVESDDRLAAYQNVLPMLEAAITASGLTHKPLVLLVINPFYINGTYTDADIIARADYCHDFASTRIGWDVLDGMAICGGQVEAAAAGYNNDNIHYTDEISRWMTRVWLASRGYLPTREQVGGSADTAIALVGPTNTSGGSQRLLTAKTVAPLLLQSTSFDTATCAWAGTVAGTGSFTQGNAKDIALATGATASSGVGGFINQNGSLMGASQNNIRGESRGFAVRVRTTTDWDAQTQAFILIRTDAVTWNSGYNGTLTGEGWGFRITSNGVTATIQGICWDSAALVVSSGSATLPTGAASSVKDLAVICNPASVNVTRGDLEWFVAGVSIGTSNYGHAGVFLAPRVEFTNGTTAVNQSFSFMPPKFLSAPQ